MPRAYCHDCGAEVPVGDDGLCFLGHPVGIADDALSGDQASADPTSADQGDADLAALEAAVAEYGDAPADPDDAIAAFEDVDDRPEPLFADVSASSPDASALEAEPLFAAPAGGDVAEDEAAMDEPSTSEGGLDEFDAGSADGAIAVEPEETLGWPEVPEGAGEGADEVEDDGSPPQRPTAGVDLMFLTAPDPVIEPEPTLGWPDAPEAEPAVVDGAEPAADDETEPAAQEPAAGWDEVAAGAAAEEEFAAAAADDGEVAAAAADDDEVAAAAADDGAWEAWKEPVPAPASWVSPTDVPAEPAAEVTPLEAAAADAANVTSDVNDEFEWLSSDGEAEPQAAPEVDPAAEIPAFAPLQADDVDAGWDDEPAGAVDPEPAPPPPAPEPEPAPPPPAAAEPVIDLSRFTARPPAGRGRRRR
ncbi:MAG TPA: hypothetical protein VGW10_19855 [Solirubrobacteraceae bacterium]|nr:hypothetical protein [Solirubrobacteraceae bacterium]